MDTTRDILEELLFIVGYQGNAEQFLEEFTYMNNEEAGLDLYDTLPKAQQNELKAIFQKKDSSKLEKFCKKYFSPEAFQQVLQKVEEKAFQEYIKITLPYLSGEQIRKIDLLFGNQFAY